MGTQIGKLETLQGKDTSPLNTEAEVIRSVSIVQKTIETERITSASVFKGLVSLPCNVSNLPICVPTPVREDIAFVFF
ncbi:hypothetical protein [Mastigocoleus testarum]|uniref:Uncharacterized protein n=1 Tax=Mastigocoleus testarum BC008 TaxID=371196 RepID=A0A0V7ZYI2_9CYAN|nr:hypothetical protein [Mastigocoleus testarum]KST69636.1 hypothetical protein BC008_04855 [Mastigocoleus testarum BC008]